MAEIRCLSCTIVLFAAVVAARPIGVASARQETDSAPISESLHAGTAAGRAAAIRSAGIDADGHLRVVGARQIRISSREPHPVPLRAVVRVYGAENGGGPKDDHSGKEMPLLAEYFGESWVMEPREYQFDTENRVLDLPEAKLAGSSTLFVQYTLEAIDSKSELDEDGIPLWRECAVASDWVDLPVKAR